MTSVNEEVIQEAVQLYRLVPAAGTSFSYVDALVSVGVERDDATTDTLRVRFNFHSDSIRQRDGLVRIDNSDDGKVERALDIMRLLPAAKKATLLRLAGWTQADAYTQPPKNKGPTALYMRVQRAKKTFDSAPPPPAQRPPPPPVQRPPPAQHPPPAHRPLPVQTIISDSIEDLLSPLSASSGISSYSATDDDFPPPMTTDHYPPLIASPPLIERSSVTSRSTTSINTRLTSHQAQHERRVEAEASDIKKSVHKVASFVYKLVKDGQIKLHKFQNSTRVAAEVNLMFGVDAVSGRQIHDAFKENRTGKSPPRRGCPSTLPEADLKDLAMLCYSLSAIEQANCAAERLDNQGLISLLGKIVNKKRKDENLAEIDEVHLYRERIQSINASKQTAGIADERDAIRVKWTTAANQKRHYQKWEQECVRLGFARLPRDEQEKAEKGHVVFYPDQESRIANFDEVHFSLDGTDEHAGGRPSATPSTDVINEAGKPAQKSSKTCTLMFGVIGNEAMPPLAVFPSASDNVNPLYAASFHEIKAQYGLSAPRHFLPAFATNLKGGVNNNIFRNWMITTVAPLWPDLADLAGKRVMLKADSGPGRLASEFLHESRALGMYFFPGLPNATEIGQEMDQLFAAFKTCAYGNCNNLYRARVAAEGADATLSFQDVGYLVFGGTVKLSDGTEVVLEAAFAKYFSKEHIQAAREKCGYFPATRNALRSDRLRHEIVEDEDGEVDEEKDPYGSMLDTLEQQNHSTVAQLVEKGYTLATLGKRNVERITATQTEGRAAVRTLPNTRERQDLLMKCSRAGHFFEITDGGGVLNSADMLLAKERKDMLVRAQALEKTKKSLEDYTMVSIEAVEVFNKPYIGWLKNDFKIALKYKHGPNAPQGETSISGWGKKKLKQQYDLKYKGKSRDQRWNGWTVKQQQELERLERGEITTVQESVIYGRAMQTQTDYLTARIQTVSKDSRMKVWKELANTLPQDEKVKISDLMSGREMTDISYSSSEEELGDDSSLATLVEIESDLVSSDDEEEARLPARRENLLDDDESLGSEDLWDDDQDSTPDDPKSSDDDKSSNGDDQSSSLDDSKSSDDAESSIGNNGKEDEEDNKSTEVEDPPGVQSRRSTRIRSLNNRDRN